DHPGGQPALFCQRDGKPQRGGHGIRAGQRPLRAYSETRGAARITGIQLPDPDSACGLTHLERHYQRLADQHLLSPGEDDNAHEGSKCVFHLFFLPLSPLLRESRSSPLTGSTYSFTRLPSASRPLTSYFRSSRSISLISLYPASNTLL